MTENINCTGQKAWYKREVEGQDLCHNSASLQIDQQNQICSTYDTTDEGSHKLAPAELEHNNPSHS